MKTLFKVFELIERDTVNEAWLTSSGVDTEKIGGTIMTIHRGDCLTELEAMKFIEFLLKEENPEHGFEIKRVFVNNFSLSQIAQF